MTGSKGTSVLIAVTGADYWTLADGTKHPCGYWPEELVVPHRIFTEAGFDITIATPAGVRPTADESGFAAESGQKLRDYIDSIGSELNATIPIEGLRAADFQLIFIPGGSGPMEDLHDHAPLGALLLEFLRSDTPIAAVCHGVAGLLSARDGDDSWAFAGYRLTAFTNAEEQQLGHAHLAPWLLEDRLRAEGGILSSADGPWQPHTVADRTLFTGQNPASTESLAHDLVKLLG